MIREATPATALRDVTLGDVSREAGVSLVTVDRVLDNRPGPKPRTEARSAARILLAALTGEDIVPGQERIRIEIFLRDNLP